MFFSKSHNNQAKKTILTAPLDWGLGHATRCVPIIRELNNMGHNVIIAAEGSIKKLLEQEFPSNVFVALPGYKVKYSRKGYWFPFKLLIQVPGIIYTVVREHAWLKRMVNEYKIDLVISDNRLGLFHKNVPSVYLTHQLFIKTGNSWSESIAQYMHGWFIKKFNECWVPDFEKGDTIAGELSHPKKKLYNVRYIGCLSRFEKNETSEKKYDLLILISGPEPQRTIFENILLEELKNYQGKVLFIRGLPGTNDKIILPENKDYKKDIFFKDHLPSDELSEAIQHSEIVVCRSGYTSVMDLLKLQQKAILVATPGQPEQEYLAYHLHRQQLFYTVPQDKFQLTASLKNAELFQYKRIDTDMNLYKKIIGDFFNRN